MPRRSCRGLKGAKKRECEEGIRLYGHLGKHEGGLHIDPYVRDMTLEGGADEETGDVSEMGHWYGLLKGDLLEDVERYAEESGEKLNSAEKQFLRKQKGAIIVENDQGFVDIDYYTSKKKLKQDWKSIQAEVDAFYSEEGRDEEPWEKY